MKKMNLMMKSLLVFTALFMVGCNNDDGIVCPEALTGELTAAETEFSGQWVFSGLVAEDALDITDDKTDNPDKDLYAQYSDCQRDLLYTFMANRGYEFKQGHTAAADCDGKQSVMGTWSLTDKVLTYVSGCSTQTVEIELNDEKDAFTYKALVNIREVNGLIRNTKVTFTFEKIQG
ncbi:DUF5004 domain-containing protein [uncultured Gelidibacter sp.]|uniref:DUF5004 domain-containing protein n=1 Tax=uncultured Gelidibacter sp. TaxID=259318 RepID=UPI002629F80D|nr:DUF5004 domain-containing protein [uncultured Gelidibacter sp.]